jgi:transposase
VKRGILWRCRTFRPPRPSPPPAALFERISQRSRPNALYGDRGYGWAKNRAAARQRGIRSHLAQPQDRTHGSGLGKTRWIGEAAHAWYQNFRRLRVCYERTQRSAEALHKVATIQLCVQRLEALPQCAARYRNRLLGAR